MGASANSKHYANWTSSLSITKLSIRGTYEFTGIIESSALVYIYYVSLVANKYREVMSDFAWIKEFICGTTSSGCYDPQLIVKFDINPDVYVSLGAPSSIHYSNWVSSLAKTTFSIRVTYEDIGCMGSVINVYRYHVSPFK